MEPNDESLNCYPEATEEDLLKHDACPICWESIEKAKKLPCGHCFHEICLKKWFRHESSCAICRKILSEHRSQTLRDGIGNDDGVGAAAIIELQMMRFFRRLNRANLRPTVTLSPAQVQEMSDQIANVFPQFTRDAIDNAVRITRSVNRAVNYLLENDNQEPNATEANEDSDVQQDEEMRRIDNYIGVGVDLEIEQDEELRLVNRITRSVNRAVNNLLETDNQEPNANEDSEVQHDVEMPPVNNDIDVAIDLEIQQDEGLRVVNRISRSVNRAANNLLETDNQEPNAIERNGDSEAQRDEEMPPVNNEIDVAVDLEIEQDEERRSVDSDIDISGDSEIEHDELISINSEVDVSVDSEIEQDEDLLSVNSDIDVPGAAHPNPVINDIGKENTWFGEQRIKLVEDCKRKYLASSRAEDLRDDFTGLKKDL